MLTNNVNVFISPNTDCVVCLLSSIIHLHHFYSLNSKHYKDSYYSLILTEYRQF